MSEPINLVLGDLNLIAEVLRSEPFARTNQNPQGVRDVAGTLPDRVRRVIQQLERELSDTKKEVTDMESRALAAEARAKRIEDAARRVASRLMIDGGLDEGEQDEARRLLMDAFSVTSPGSDPDPAGESVRVPVEVLFQVRDWLQECCHSDHGEAQATTVRPLYLRICAMLTAATAAKDTTP